MKLKNFSSSKSIRNWSFGLAGFTLLTAHVGIASASSVDLGVLSYNTLIPSAPGSAGVNDFEIDNFTGASALPPDFPVVNGLSFKNTSLVLTFVGGSQQTVMLGNLVAGADTPVSLEFSASTNFTSALFTATLGSTTLSIAGGATEQASSSQISVDLTPASGMTLVADSDLAVLSVPTQSTAVPEPSSWCECALLVTMLAILNFSRKAKS